MTAPTPTAATPEEQSSYLHSLRSYASQSVSVTIHQAVLERWSRCAEAQAAENERLRVMADEPTTKRVWDGIQAMAGLFAEPDCMPTVLEFKAAFDAAFVVDGKPYDVERIKAEWQADYAAMEARATTAEAALSASQERELVMREALSNAARFVRHLAETESDEVIYASACECEAQIDAALQPQETADVR